MLLRHISRIAVLATIALAPMTTVARAEGSYAFETGGGLIDLCASSEVGDQNVCIGYIMAMSDVLGEGKQTISGYTGCIPNELRAGQVKRIVVAWFWQHPELWRFNAPRTIAKAMSELY